jgi:hypothetical protein
MADEAMPPAAGAGVVLGVDIGVSKAVVAFGEGGASSFGAELVRACANGLASNAR